VAGALGIQHNDLAGRGLIHDPIYSREQYLTGVLSGLALHTGTDQRVFGLQQRHCLSLHIRAHQGAVGVVVLQERDQRGCHRDCLFRRHVHEVDPIRRFYEELLASAHGDAIRCEGAVRIERDVGLGDCVQLFLVGREPQDLVRYEGLDIDLRIGKLG
jgi:hypothetical protein